MNIGNDSCFKTSDNKDKNCPARMDDGRIFTDYRPSSSVDDMIRYSNNVMSSYEYRQFLINNANQESIPTTKKFFKDIATYYDENFKIFHFYFTHFICG